jgi:8-hydroxy-5-deazaflavin:NADPH oxidoreductase
VTTSVPSGYFIANKSFRAFSQNFFIRVIVIKQKSKAMKKIGIIGSGVVAKALATGLKKHGYSVMVGSSDKEKRNKLAAETGAPAGSFEEAASFGSLVILAVKGTAAEKIVASLKGKLEGRTVIDATNPLADKPPVNGVLQYFTSLDDSLMERLQKLAPKANFVKAFSSVGNAFMIDPPFGSKPTMFICGNNEASKKEVESLLTEVGWDVEDMGAVEAARAIEPLCMLWCIPGLRENRWTHAFRLEKLQI